MCLTKAVYGCETVHNAVEFGWSGLGQRNQNHIVWPKPQWWSINYGFSTSTFQTMEMWCRVAMLTTKISCVVGNSCQNLHHLTGKNEISLDLHRKQYAIGFYRLYVWEHCIYMRVTNASCWNIWVWERDSPDITRQTLTFQCKCFSSQFTNMHTTHAKYSWMCHS